MKRFVGVLNGLRTWVVVVIALVVIAAAAATRIPSRRLDATTLDAGDQIKIPGVDFSHADLSLVVATSPACAASRQSAIVYQRLRELAAAAGTPLYFIQANRMPLGSRSEPKATLGWFGSGRRRLA
jgi:hypothetical protein